MPHQDKDYAAQQMRASQNVGMGSTVKRVSHSEELTNAIQFLERAINGLEHAADSIEGLPVPLSTGGILDGAAVPSEYPPLLSILNTTPDAIRQQANRIIDQTARLREMLRV